MILTLVLAETMSDAIAREDLVRCAKDVARATALIDEWRHEIDRKFLLQHESAVQG